MHLDLFFFNCYSIFVKNLELGFYILIFPLIPDGGSATQGGCTNQFEIDADGNLILIEKINAEASSSGLCNPLIEEDVGNYAEVQSFSLYIDVNEYLPKPNGIDQTERIDQEENVRNCTFIKK